MAVAVTVSAVSDLYCIITRGFKLVVNSAHIRFINAETEAASSSTRNARPTRMRDLFTSTACNKINTPDTNGIAHIEPVASLPRLFGSSPYLLTAVRDFTSYFIIP